MVKPLPKITALWPIFGLFLVTLLLAFLNYQPDTWLTGWDNLHPEFNFALNLKRSLNTTWQEYQGLGLLGGMAHAAALPRELLLSVLNSFLPSSFLRYLWTFLMLIIGPIGTYLLAYSTLLKKFSPFTRRLAGFFAGLFYLLNLSTVQTFYTPFEAFVSFYGFLPWILYTTIRYLGKPSRGNFLLLVSCLLFAAPSFYIQTLFLVLCICLFPILLGFLLSKKFSLHSLWVVSCWLLVVIATQAYWLFPVGYFSATSSSVTVNAPQNLVATPEIIARNSQYATLGNIALLKGFWFRYADINANGQFQLMLGPWINHLGNYAIIGIGYAFFALILIGILFALKNKLSNAVPLALVFITCLLFLAGLYPHSLPILEQAFRSVYTKWSIPTSLVYSLFFSVGVVYLLQLFSSLHDRLTVLLTTFSLVFALLALTGPAFSGNLIYPQMKQVIPHAYFELFDYFKTQDPSTRIANFPQNTFWGWQFYDWGYRGSGFLWYGVEQPLLDRAFDVWSPASAEYYKEIKTAVYGQNNQQLSDIINKYSINWILVDNSITSPGTDDKTSLYLPELKKLLNTNPHIKLAKTIDFLDIYQVTPDTHPEKFISAFSISTPINKLTNEPVNSLIEDTPSNNHAVDLSKGRNCDPLNSGTFSTQVTENEVIYTSQGANNCDHFLYPSLQLNQLYQIKIEHKNSAGLPFLYCVEPYPLKTCFLYGYLSKTNDWTTTTLTLPALKTGEYGFSLHLFNNSLGNIKTSNSWRKITIVTPSHTNSQAIVNNGMTMNDQRMTIANVSHPAYSLYTLTATVDQPEADVTLTQAYDQGWQAFLVDPTVLRQPDWMQYLQSVFLVPLPESQHHLASGWANSWTIPEGTHNLLIVYLPQHLQYFGFSLLLLLPFLFFLHHRHK